MPPVRAFCFGVACLLSACSLLAPSEETLSSEYNKPLGSDAGDASSAGDATTSDVDAEACTCVLDHAVATCESGQCLIQECEQGYLDIDRTDANGCELESPIPTDALVLWLAADEGVEESGGKVIAWRDRSSHRYDHTQPNSGIQPTVLPAKLSGRPVVDFQKQRLENASFGGTLADGFSLFAIVQRDTSTGPPFVWGAFLDLFDNERTNGLFFARHGSGDDFIAGFSNQPATLYTTGSTYAPDVPHLIALTLGPSGVSFRWDGQVPAFESPDFVPTALVLERSYVGGNSSTLEFHDGFIAEIILYETGLADGAAIEQYLATKWGCCP